MTPLHPDEPVARLLTSIIVKVLLERERDDLLARFDADGARIDDIPEGFALYVGDELVTKVAEDTVRVGLALQAATDNAEN